MKSLKAQVSQVSQVSQLYPCPNKLGHYLPGVPSPVSQPFPPSGGEGVGWDTWDSWDAAGIPLPLAQ